MATHIARKYDFTAGQKVYSAQVDEELNQLVTAHNTNADNIESSSGTVQSNLDTHTARTDNPHVVTKAQTGLGNCDNTSDANKPVSTAQKAYIDNQDLLAVHKTGDESVSGAKTFSTSPVIPTPTTDMQAATKKYVDDKDATAVHKTGNETVAGVKTFSSSPAVPTPTANGEAANKGYVDTVDAARKTYVDTADGLRYTKTEMQASGSALMHWDNITNKPNLADNHWKAPVANRAALPLTSNTVEDCRVVLDDGDGKQAAYLCIATTGTVDQQWSKIADVDWMTEEQTRITQENARVAAENTRDSQETARQSAESTRQSTFEDSQTSRAAAFTTSENSREATFTTNETARQTTFETNEAARSAWQTKTKALDAMDIRLAESLDNITESMKSVVPDVSVSTYARVSPLSSKAREGAMNVTVKGNTLKNLVKEGNFPDTSEWTSNYSATLTASNNIMTFTATQQYQGFFQALDLLSGHKYYISALVKASSNLVKFALYKTVDPWSTPINIAHSGSGNYERLSNIGTAASNTNWIIRVRDENTSGWALVSTQSVICIDMGADASNPLYNKTAAEMDLIAGQLYFDGVASVVAGQIKSIGKNKFNKTEFTDRVIQKATATYASRVVEGGYDCLKFVGNAAYVDLELGYKVFEANKQYTITCTAKYVTAQGGLFRVKYTDGTYGAFPGSGVITTSFVKYTFTTAAGKTVSDISLYRNSTGDNYFQLDTFQIEEGTAETTYEPNTETVKSLPSATLRSLPNGVTDYIEAMRYVKNCELRALQASDIGSINTSYTNLDYALISKPTDYIGYNKFSGYGLAFTLDGMSGFDGNYDDAANIGKVTSAGHGYYFWYGVTKGTTLVQAQTELTGKKLIYQLTTPIITELLPETLKSSPKGSIIYECVRREIGTYGTNAVVSNTSAPIKTMRKLYKVLSDGTKMPLSVITGITIAGDKLSFTHTSLASGDNIEWEYEFDSALSTTPLIEYNYCNDADDFSATNGIVNGNIVDTSGWTCSVNGTLSASNNILTCVSTAAFVNIFNTTIIPNVADHKIYFRGDIRKTTNNGGNIIAKISGTTNFNGEQTAVSLTNPTQNTWYPCSGIITTNASMVGSLLRAYLYSNQIETVELKYADMLDLTAIFGAGNEPSKPVMDAIMALYTNSWFDKTVNPLVSLKDMFNLLVPKTQSAWAGVTLLNGYTSITNYPAEYKKDDSGFVHLRGRLATGSANNNAFQLPVGFRPLREFFMPLPHNSTTTIVRGVLHNDGNFAPQATYTDWIDLSAITPFLAEQ